VILMAILLKTTPRKRKKKGSKMAQARYAQKQKEKGTPGVNSPQRRVKVKAPASTGETQVATPGKYSNWRGRVRVVGPKMSEPSPLVNFPPITEPTSRVSVKPGGKQRTGGVGSLAPGLGGKVDPGMFRKPEHFDPEQTPEEEEEEVVDEIPWLHEIMEQMRVSRNE